MPTTSTPVAIGSSVPACPTRRVPARRRIRATTSCEVHPEGLSAMTSPLAAVTGPRHRPCPGPPGRLDGPGPPGRLDGPGPPGRLDGPGPPGRLDGPGPLGRPAHR